MSEGFLKIVSQNSFEWGPHANALSTIVDDPARFKKVAGPKIRFDWGDIKPVKGHTLIHVIALGDFEKTGCNMNGDAFEEWFCKKIHHTFVKNAKFYANHRTFDPADPEKDVSKGHILRSAHNDEMGRTEVLLAADQQKNADWLGKYEKGEPLAVSMGFNCIFAGQLVQVKDRGLVKIEEILEGDEVISSSGTWRKVRKTFINDLAGRKQVTISVTGSAEKLKATDDHPIYLVKKDKVRSKNGRLTVNPEWSFSEVPAGEAEVGDYMVRPVRQFSGKNSPGQDLAYVAGMYIGDGHLGKKDGEYGGAVHLSINASDTAITQKLISICSANQWRFSVDYYRDGDERKVTTFRIRDTKVTEFCMEMGIKKRKRCPEGVFDWRFEDAIALLAGYHDADGCVSGNQLRFSSVLPEIAFTIQEMALACGLPMVCWKDYLGDRVTGFSGAEFAYIGLISRGNLEPLAKDSVKVSLLDLGFKERSKLNFFEQDGKSFVAMPIRKVEIENSNDDKVFCLNIEEDNNFVVSGMLVHNCFYDECSICGHKAKGSRNYCNDVKKNAEAPYGMNKILPDGRKCFVFNRAGYFNDLSRVGTGADMIAFDLQKVASLADRCNRVLSGAELGELFTQKAAQPSRRMNIVYRMSRIENSLKEFGMPPLPNAVSANTISNKIAALLNSKSGSVQDMMTYLVNRNVILPVRDFFKVAAPLDYVYYLQDIDSIEKLFVAEGGYSWAQKRGHLKRVCENVTYDSGKTTMVRLPEHEENLLVCNFSVRPQFSNLWSSANSVKIACIKSSQPISLTARQEALACEYLSYRLSAIEGLSDRGVNIMQNNILLS